MAVISHLVPRAALRCLRTENGECEIHPRGVQRVFRAGERGGGRPHTRRHGHPRGGDEPPHAAGRPWPGGVPEYLLAAAEEDCREIGVEKRGQAAPSTRRRIVAAITERGRAAWDSGSQSPFFKK